VYLMLVLSHAADQIRIRLDVFTTLSSRFVNSIEFQTHTLHIVSETGILQPNACNSRFEET
jgi:hypothetical protein